MALSRRFIEAVKLSPLPAYTIAQLARLHPATLSKLVSGAEQPRPSDPRVLAVARVIGLEPSECFAESPLPELTDEMRISMLTDAIDRMRDALFSGDLAAVRAHRRDLTRVLATALDGDHGSIR